MINGTNSLGHELRTRLLCPYSRAPRVLPDTALTSACLRIICISDDDVDDPAVDAIINQYLDDV